jgi:hypothetical protein
VVLDFRDWSGQSTTYGKVLLRLDLSNGDPFQTHQLALFKAKTEEVKDTNHLQEQCIQMDYTFSLPFAYGGSESF